MSRPIVIPLAVLALLQAVFAVDFFKTRNIELQFTDEDVVPKTSLKSLMPESYANGFIGDLEVGVRYPDETILRRDVVFDNPSNSVVTGTLSITINNGVIHYINIQNYPGSHAVVCDNPNSLGSRRSIITLRVSPNTRSTLSLFIAAH